MFQRRVRRWQEVGARVRGASVRVGVSDFARFTRELSVATSSPVSTDRIRDLLRSRDVRFGDYNEGELAYLTPNAAFFLERDESSDPTAARTVAGHRPHAGAVWGAGPRGCDLQFDAHGPEGVPGSPGGWLAVWLDRGVQYRGHVGAHSGAVG